jgi:hypothetical protein
MEIRKNAMAEQNSKSSGVQSFRKIQSIYFSMLFSVVTYLGFGLWLRPTPHLSGGTKETAVFTQIFYFLSAALIATVFIVRKKTFSRPPIISPSPEEALKLMNFYHVGHLLIYVLCTAIGLLGLFLLFLTGSLQHFLNLTLVSIILMVVLYPRKLAKINL